VTVAVQTSPEADAQARVAASWWRENRPRAPTRFVEELRAAFALLAESPEAGVRVRRRGIRALRRLLLPVTAYHVYYVYQPALARVAVISIWSALRGRGPRVRLP
jgi:plasmid stabilization system protein ParE